MEYTSTPLDRNTKFELNILAAKLRVDRKDFLRRVLPAIRDFVDLSLASAPVVEGQSKVKDKKCTIENQVA